MKKRLLIVTGSLTSGGSERNVALLANRLSRVCDVFVAHLLPSKCFYSFDPKIKILDFSSSNRLFRIFHWRRLLRKYQKRIHFDTVLSFFFSIGALTTLALKGKHVRLVCRETGDPTNEKRNKYAFRFYDWVLCHSDCVVFQTEFQKSFYSQKLQKKSIVINNPVVLPSDTSLCNQNSNKFITVGRLSKEKNHITLLKAFAIFHKQYPSYRLDIFGEGPCEKDLSAFISENNLSSFVFLRGTTSNIFDELKKSFCYVHPSLHEGMPNALLEALLLGVPVISSNWAGNQCVIHSGEDALLFSATNQNDLFQKMVAMVEKPDLYLSLSRKGISRRNEFSMETIIAKWISILKI